MFDARSLSMNFLTNKEISPLESTNTPRVLKKCWDRSESAFRNKGVVERMQRTNSMYVDFVTTEVTVVYGTQYVLFYRSAQDPNTRIRMQETQDSVVLELRR